MHTKQSVFLGACGGVLNAGRLRHSNISYSSVALNLLGEIVARASGTGSLPLFLKAEVFGPLGMDDSQLGVAEDRKKDREVALAAGGAANYSPLSC